MQELKTELSSLRELKRDEKKRYIQLQQENADLAEELTKEKVRPVFCCTTRSVFF